MSSATLLHPSCLPTSTAWSALSSAGDYPQSSQYPGRPSSWKERWESPFRDGLPTPPGTRTMTSSSLNSYNGSSNGPVQGRYLPMYQAPAAPTTTFNATGRDHQHQGVNDEQTLTSTAPDSGYESKRNSNASIATYLQIPSTINNSKGSLSEFAADITCLFWFESGATLCQIEEAHSIPWSALHLKEDTTPSMGFRKWVTTILSTTQVTQNVILLALLFVYRLKNFNPAVSGKKGSEFRLFTIALMLGNKFLDDNTYTNKTWAEVSGIAVQEIHIMEVEFLSNMRYNLFVSENEWVEWHRKLSTFWTFLENAARLSQGESTRPSLPLTPTHPASPQKLPSPPSPTHAAYPYGMAHSTQLPPVHPLSLPPTLPPSPSRPYSDQTSFESRKRSFDSSFDELPPKRHMGQVGHPSSLPYGSALQPMRSSTTNLGPAANASSATSQPAMANHGPRLPVPRLQTAMNGASGEGYGIQLPLPTGRAMATVYPNQQPNWTQTQPVTPVSSGSATAMSLYANPIPPLADLQVSMSTTPSRSSPTGPTFPSLTPTSHLSPSYFLTNRNSPYRPIRHVHTLLNPPPTTSLQNPTRNISFDQMRYQPLSKNPTEQRTGVVPWLHHHDPWHPQMSMTSTGLQHQYRG